MSQTIHSHRIRLTISLALKVLGSTISMRWAQQAGQERATRFFALMVSQVGRFSIAR